LLHGALSALLLPLLVLYVHLGGLLPEPHHHYAVDLPWYLDDYAIAPVPPLLGLAGAYIRSLVVPSILGRWVASGLAVVAIYAIIAALCFVVTHAMFSYSLAAMAAIIVGHFVAPQQHRRLALFVLSGLLTAIFVVDYAGFAINGSPHAGGQLVTAANVASGCAIAVMTMRRHYSSTRARSTDSGTPSAG
jgi:hypothetical protein